MKYAVLLVLVEVLVGYAYLAGFEAGTRRAPREEPFRGD